MRNVMIWLCALRPRSLSKQNLMKMDVALASSSSSDDVAIHYAVMSAVDAVAYKSDAAEWGGSKKVWNANLNLGKCVHSAHRFEDWAFTLYSNFVCWLVALSIQRHHISKDTLLLLSHSIYRFTTIQPVRRRSFCTHLCIVSKVSAGYPQVRYGNLLRMLRECRRHTKPELLSVLLVSDAGYNDPTSIQYSTFFRRRGSPTNHSGVIGDA